MSSSVEKGSLMIPRLSLLNTWTIHIFVDKSNAGNRNKRAALIKVCSIICGSRHPWAELFVEQDQHPNGETSVQGLRIEDRHRESFDKLGKVASDFHDESQEKNPD
jgi:hypothetical protein